MLFRAPFWWWNTLVLYQTLFLAVAQVFAEALDSFFQLAIMSMILVAGLGILLYLQPLHDSLLQNMQVGKAKELCIHHTIVIMLHLRLPLPLAPSPSFEQISCCFCALCKTAAIAAIAMCFVALSGVPCRVPRICPRGVYASALEACMHLPSRPICICP